METNDSKASEQVESNPVEESNQTQESNNYVPKKAYEEVSSDMHKYKSKTREAQARINELEARIKAAEESKLRENEEWKTLYEREKAEREVAEDKRNQEKELYLKSVKLSALKSELGGRVRDEYLQFADINSIELREDGSLSSESVQLVANQFRQNHPSLIDKGPSANITSPAPSSSGVLTEEKSINEMSHEEKLEMLKKISAQNIR